MALPGMCHLLKLLALLKKITSTLEALGAFATEFVRNYRETCLWVRIEKVSKEKAERP